LDISFLIRQRLTELGLEQKGLAQAAEVTESYVSQLLTRRKLPPAPSRTDIYQRIEGVLRIPAGELARLAEVQRQGEMKRRVLKAPEPLFAEFRALILRKCQPEQQEEVGRIFVKESFGEIERLVAQKLLDMAQAAAREELRREDWLRSLAQAKGCSYEDMRVITLEFLDAELWQVSSESCVSLLEPMVERWSIDLKSFALEIVLKPRGRTHRFAFTEQLPPSAEEPGWREFLNTPSLSGQATPEELALLSGLRFGSRRPTALYYYREWQSLRDPLHFAVDPLAT
jgi:transcriptional regulator with XRE-family HTH domain